ncbi:hypothetical protein Bca101_065151 [Brassica carinata]
MFKWISEAIIDEIKMVDSKHMELVEDVQGLTKMMMEQFELHKAWLEREMRSKIDENARKRNEEMKMWVNEKARRMNEEMQVKMNEK